MSAAVLQEYDEKRLSSEEGNHNHRDVEAVTIAHPLDGAHQGVELIETTYGVYKKWSKCCLFIGLGLAAYIYSLDGSTTWTYLAWATSSFNDHSVISTISVAQAIMIAVGKPIIAKVADVGSRAWAFVVVAVFYVVGYIAIASAQNVGTVAGGIILYAIGYTGLQLLNTIIIADITTLQYRALVSGLVASPFLINGFIGANVSASILEKSSWRWGYGMFAILIPAALIPIVLTLVWGESKARKIINARRAENPSQYAPAGPKQSIVQQIQNFISQLDVIGLILLGAALACFLLPFTLVSKKKNTWSNGSMIAMLVVGIVLFPVFAFYEWKFAKHPVIPSRFLKNRALVLGAMIGFFDFFSFYILQTYLYSFIVVVKPWSLVNLTYFNLTQTVALTFFGIIAGVIMRFTHRYKYLLVFGLGVRLLGTGVMIHSRGANGSDFEIVATQILQGFGGGFAAVASMVAAQASVPHADVATASAFVLLVTEIGNAVGNAVAGALWTSMMPSELAKNLPGVPAATIAKIFGSIAAAKADPTILPGVILAYDQVMKIMCIIGMCIAVIPFVMSWFMPNYYLGEQQNAVDGVGLDGVRKHNPDEEVKA